MLISAQEVGLKLAGGIKSETIPFQLIKNLVVIPVKLNGHKMNFIVDSGLNETILFGQYNDAINHKALKQIKLKGLGNNDKGTIGYYSSQNAMIIGKNFYNLNLPIIIIQDQDFNLFSRLGIDVHGIIGYDFFRNQPIKIDYSKQQITFYKSILNVKKLNKYESSNLEISAEKKPFVEINFTHKHDFTLQKMLIDIGNSDGLWLFEDQLPQLTTPNDAFSDELGKGFSGSINGIRGTIENVMIGKYQLNNPLIAVPEKESIQFINIKNNRKGSIGNEILRRFSIILDYNNAKLYYRSNKNFKDDFHYNRSGLTIIHSDFDWKKEEVKLNMNGKTIQNTTESQVNYRFVMKPVYKIEAVRKKSNAEQAGLKPNDQLERLNGKLVNKMTLSEIEHFMQINEHQEITIDVLRNNQPLKFNFILNIPFTE